MKNKACSKKASPQKATKVSLPKNKTHKGFPDLTEFRKSIHLTGESIVETVIKGRG